MNSNTSHLDINNRHKVDYTNKVALDTAINEGLSLCHILRQDPSISDDEYNILANNVQYYMYKRALRELDSQATQQQTEEVVIETEQEIEGGVEVIIAKDADE